MVESNKQSAYVWPRWGQVLGRIWGSWFGTLFMVPPIWLWYVVTKPVHGLSYNDWIWRLSERRFFCDWI
jgi:hypothetical protein